MKSSKNSMRNGFRRTITNHCKFVVPMFDLLLLKSITLKYCIVQNYAVSLMWFGNYWWFHLLSGLWAVFSTADVCLKGRIEMQESAQWETLFKTNVFGTLKAARTFYPLLVSQKGSRLYSLPFYYKTNV